MSPKCRKQIKQVLLLFASLALSLLVVEVVCQVCLADRTKLKRDERNVAYRYDEKLGWFPIANHSLTFTASQPIHVKQNSRGFRDIEHRLVDKPRIIILGDSFVWGYDVERDARFTDKLTSIMPDWSIYNLGVSGYGTDQELLLLKQQYEYYDPDVVLLVLNPLNDYEDNNSNKRYGYYKPYFQIVNDNLTLSGVPVPKAEHYIFQEHPILSSSVLFRAITAQMFNLGHPTIVSPVNITTELLSEINDFVIRRGGQFLVAIIKSDARVREAMELTGIPHVYLTSAADHIYPTHGKHWTPEGHTLVSEIIAGWLVEEGFVHVDN